MPSLPRGRFSLPVLLFLLATLACAPGATRGQDLMPAPADAAATAIDPASVPDERATPRATVRTFLKSLLDAAETPDGAARNQLLDAAAATLDTSVLVTDSQARNLAIKLKADVLDRHARIEYDDIPDDPTAPPFVLVDTPVGEVVVARTPEGDWRFTRGTVESIDALAEHFASSDLAEGVTSIEALATPADLLRQAMPPALLQRAFLLYWYQWIGIAVLIVAALVAGRALTYLALGLLNTWLRRFGAEAGEAQRARLVAPLTYSIASVIWWTFDGWLDLPLNVAKVAQAAAVIAFGIGMLLFLMRLVDVLAVRLSRWALGTESKFDDLLVPFASKSAKVVVIVLGVMMILHNLDFNLTGALATLGIGGLAFALAAKDTISNLFGSLTVIADRPFQIGDWVVVEGNEGTVESLGFRSTRIRTFYNSLITVPNSTLINAAVDNYGARAYRRYRTVLSVTYGTPPDRMEAFCEAIRQIIRESPYTRKDSFHIYFNDYGPSSLDILVYMFFQTPDWATELRERHRFNLDILRAAKRLGVDFAFPTQTLYLERGAGAAQPSEEPFMSRERIDAELARGRGVGTDVVRTTTGPRGHRPPPVTEPPSRQGGESADGGGDG